LRSSHSSTRPGAESQAVALTIAGFDPSGGAGVTADIAVFAAHGLYGTAAITALTIQSTLGVTDVRPVDPAWLLETVRCVSADLPAAGIKIGMLGSEQIVRTVAGFLRLAPSKVPVVLDPVLRSSSGRELLEPSAMRTLHDELLPLVSWATPNWAELAALTGLKIRSLEQARRAADALGQLHPALHIVVTGGDQKEPVDLLRMPGGAVQSFRGRRIETTSTHGTGCAFSCALLAQLIDGEPPGSAVGYAKAYVTEALRRAPGIGHGRGPLDLLWTLRPSRRHS
jgi:hydroxymethylpyrimidine/phosphomethylpyrimidine kinase